MKKSYPYCRPSKRISSKTPKTVYEISQKQLQSLSRKKKKNPKKKVFNTKK